MDAIKIMGAGPAGLTAAITLANAGRPVLVYERAQDVGTRHDGDYEGIENWSTSADVWEEFASWGLVTSLARRTANMPGDFGRRVEALVADTGKIYQQTYAGVLLAENGKIKLLREALDTLAASKAFSND